MPNKKIVPELTIEERIANATRDRDQARDELIRLIQQKPSSNFFVRTFERIRNFFHSLLPTWNMFKSPLELALERFKKDTPNFDEVTTKNSEDKRTPLVNAVNLFKTYIPGQSSAQAQQEPEQMTPKQEIAKALKAFIIKSSINDDIKNALNSYVDEVTDQLTIKGSAENINCPETWTQVRNNINIFTAVNKTGLTSAELEDILFKLNALYPCTVQYDKKYEDDQQKEMCSDSVAMLARFFPVLRSSNAHPVFDVTSQARNFFAKDENKTVVQKTKDELINEKELTNKILVLKGTLQGFAKVKPLKEELESLFEQCNAEQPDFEQIDVLNTKITGLVAALQVSLTATVKPTQQDIIDAKEYVGKLQGDINLLKNAPVQITEDVIADSPTLTK